MNRDKQIKNQKVINFSSTKAENCKNRLAIFTIFCFSATQMALSNSR